MRYVYHKDIPNNQWNVFKVLYGVELYVCSFSSLEEAQHFCQVENEVEVNYV
jgi:hypothetical protein